MWPLGSSKSTLPIEDASPDSSELDRCPVDEGTRKAWLARSSSVESTPGPSNASSAFALLQAKSETHSTVTRKHTGLSKERVISSIPRWSSEGDSPASSPESSSSGSSSNWVYPSPNQFYSAMSRKNHNPRAEDMNVVVPIHNAVNEKAWKEILEWERIADEQTWKSCGGPKLVSFKGRPKDITWTAWTRNILG
jgi:cytochrome c heme-lyase